MYACMWVCTQACVCVGGEGAEGCSNFKVNSNNHLNNHVKLPAVRDKERRQSQQASCICFYWQQRVLSEVCDIYYDRLREIVGLCVRDSTRTGTRRFNTGAANSKHRFTTSRAPWLIGRVPESEARRMLTPQHLIRFIWTCPEILQQV